MGKTRNYNTFVAMAVESTGTDVAGGGCGLGVWGRKSKPRENQGQIITKGNGSPFRKGPCS